MPLVFNIYDKFGLQQQVTMRAPTVEEIAAEHQQRREEDARPFWIEGISETARASLNRLSNDLSVARFVHLLQNAREQSAHIGSEYARETDLQNQRQLAHYLRDKRDSLLRELHATETILGEL